MTVVLYTLPGCVQCAATHRKMNQLGIEHDVRDVSTDDASLQHVKSLGYQQAPVVELSTGEHWGGYDPDRIMAILAA